VLCSVNIYVLAADLPLITSSRPIASSGTVAQASAKKGSTAKKHENADKWSNLKIEARVVITDASVAKRQVNTAKLTHLIILARARPRLCVHK